MKFLLVLLGGILVACGERPTVKPDSVCSALAISPCVTKNKKEEESTGSVAHCKTQRKDYDSVRGVCIVPTIAFCAKELGMVAGSQACQVPASQSDCDTIGKELSKTLSWENNECKAATSIAGQGKLDSSIRIAWNGKTTVQGARNAFVNIGSVTVRPSKNDYHQVSMLKKKNSTCELRRAAVSGSNFKVDAKGPVSTCEGKIIVINTKTGDYNVKEFSVKIN